MRKKITDIPKPKEKYRKFVTDMITNDAECYDCDGCPFFIGRIKKKCFIHKLTKGIHGRAYFEYKMDICNIYILKLNEALK